MAGVVVIGGGAGGDAAALTLRQRGCTLPITLVSEERTLPCERPLLSKDLMRGERTEQQVGIRPPDAYERAGVDVRLGVRCVGIDPERRVAHMEDGDDLPYEWLVLATGSTARRLPGLPDAANLHTLRSLADAVALRRELHDGARLLVVGAGFLGCEVAASARIAGCRVTLCDVADGPMLAAIGPVAAAAFARLHAEHGVDVRMATGVEEWEVLDSRVTAARLTDGASIAVDAVLVAVGAEPNLALPRQLGLAIDSGGVAVDDRLGAGTGIVCVGDIAAVPYALYERRLRVEHWQTAQRHGEHAAGTIARASSESFTELPWFWSDQYEFQLTQAGSCDGADDVVVRGDEQSSRFSVVYLRRGRVVACIGVNDGVTVRRARRLISDAVEVRGAALADPASDIRALAATA
ncbi:MAG: FAD-dependent oxidoreductase [Candidatus Dormibacteraeota bacterium]|nr:FAD-dependent oxidoreductase [Candidatus Dormibacteraeota bacterium]